VLLVVAGAGMVGGCTGPGADEAAQAATSFEQLVADRPDRACDLLAGHTREAVEKSAKTSCAEALPGLDLPSGSTMQSVEVYGHDAQVRLADDVVFLARFADGWKVTAAGCKPGSVVDAPYDCNVSGR
jgi:hypothetical protein